MLKYLIRLTYWQWLVIGVCFIPIFLVVMAFFQEGQRIPYYDDWDGAYPVVIEALEGRLTLNSLLAFHNEHPILFTRLVHVLSAVLTKWDLAAALSVNLLLGIGTTLLFLRMVSLDFGSQTAWIAAIPSFFLFLTLRAWYDWILVFQTQFLFVTFFFMLGAWLLHRSAPNWRSLIAACLATACATFSLGSGLLAWPLMFVIVFARGYRRFPHYLFFIGCAAATLLVHQHYASQSGNFDTTGTILEFLRSQWLYAYLMLLSAPVAVYDPSRTDLTDYSMGLIVIGALGAALLAASLYLRLKSWLRRRLFRSQGLFWLAVIGYSVLSIAGIVYGRYGGTLGYNLLSTRYTPLTSVFWAVVFVLLIHQLLEWSKTRRGQFGVIFNTICMTLISGLMAAAVMISPTDPDLNREDFENCNFGHLYFGLPFDCPPDEPRVELMMEFGRRLVDTANRRLALFARPTLDVPITIESDPVVITESDPPYQVFAYWRERINPTSILLAAPGLIRYPHVYLPASHDRVAFEVALFIPVETPDPSSDGVRYVVRLLTRDEEPLIEAEAIFDPASLNAPIPFSVDLTPYIGQTIMLELMTDPRGNSRADNSLWIEPRLHFSR